jgi:2-hydroxycyclohexanecarboxyl-CoA dehydrogenase
MLRGMRGLAGKIVVVTGAGGAIGRAISIRFAEEGAKVAVLDKNEAAGAETARLAGGGALALGCDITDYAAVARAVAEVESQLGPIDVLVNNAGWDRLQSFADTEPGFWETLIAINLRGPLNLHHVVGRRMLSRRSGRVVNIASDAGRVGSSGEAVYAACKGGLIAFSKTVAREWAQAHVNVNVVCPGPTDTPLFHSFLGEGEDGKKIHASLERSIPWKRIGRPDDIPGAVAFLASDDAAFITGQVLSVSGGLTMHG